MQSLGFFLQFSYHTLKTRRMPIGIQLDYYSDTEYRYTVKLHRHSILTTVTATSTVVDQWISDIYHIYRSHLHHLIVGLKVELWLPIPTLQICVGHRCLIFRFFDADDNPESLVQFLAEPVFTFVGVGIEEDVKKLEDREGLSVGWTSDLRSLAAEELCVRELKQAGLKRLATVVLGANVDSPKHFRMNKWITDFLVLDGVLDACVDAFLSFEIGRKLSNGNRRFSVVWAVLFFLSLGLELWLWDHIGTNGAQSLL